MTKSGLIISTLQTAIKAGVKKSRKEWCAELHTSYVFFCQHIIDHNLHAAIEPLRAERATKGRIIIEPVPLPSAPPASEISNLKSEIRSAVPA